MSRGCAIKNSGCCRSLFLELLLQTKHLGICRMQLL